MPKNSEIKKIMVIGSGPIVIGQAAEFDYAGTQACQALREEGYQVVLVNPNPATIMTDAKIADAVYMEPLDTESAERIIYRERPDAILGTLGGQIGLNLTVALAKEGILDKYGVKVIGTDLDAIDKASDRERFKELMARLGEPVAPSEEVSTVEQALAAAQDIGYPVVVRPFYTLGGTGGGFAKDPEELRDIAESGLSVSPVHRCLVERSLTGWKEIEYEVMRDQRDNAIVVCAMENVDPVGIHTGDSVVVAPLQTLTDRENQLLRDVSLRIIRALGICGGCNVQLALNHRPHLRQAGGRAEPGRDRQSGHRFDLGRLRAGDRLRGHQVPPLPLRQVRGRRPAPRHPDEGHRRDHGPGPHPRGEPQQGHPLPGEQVRQPGGCLPGKSLHRPTAG